jgi:hypothetical protein
LHVLAEPAGFAIAIALEMAAVVAVPAMALVRLRSAIGKREIAWAYFESAGARARSKGESTPVAGGPTRP